MVELKATMDEGINILIEGEGVTSRKLADLTVAIFERVTDVLGQKSKSSKIALCALITAVAGDIVASAKEDDEGE